MDNFEDFMNALANLELGWTNQWAFIDQRDKLLSQRRWALKNKCALLKKGYDVIDIYNQLDEFEACTRSQSAITDDNDEKILLAALEYANSNRPIISSKLNNNLFNLAMGLGDTDSIKLNRLQYKYDVLTSLLAFYLSYKDNLDLYEVFNKFLSFNDFLINTYPEKKENFYCVPYVIIYLKHLIKIKEFEKAQFLIKNFIIEPIGKGDTDALEKIKMKLNL